MDRNAYNHIRSGGAGFIEMPRGLIAVWGKEAVPFLDGMITNDMKALEDGQQMIAAFPNAQGRLLGVIRVTRIADRYLIETEDVTREKIFQNLFRFTFAGDFFVENLSEQFRYFEIFGPQKDVYNPSVTEKFEGALVFLSPHGASYFVPKEVADNFRTFLTDGNGCVVIDDELYETLRIETGVPKFGVDMDETTIIPELGLEGMISYT
jgi:folate-binding Fe-S cluster repair protein YgfZ